MSRVVMQATNTSETSVDFYGNKRRNIPEGNLLQENHTLFPGKREEKIFC
jgi:hypothetical protein